MIARALLAAVLLAAILLPGLPAAAQDELPELTLFLGFIPNIQFAPVYVALEKGYFAQEAGVRITLEYGDENLGAERIAAGELRFGIFSGEQVLLARYGGRPLVYLYEWYRRYPVAVAALADSGIARLEDLRGRTVGVPGRFGASYVGLRALLASGGLTEEDIRLEEIGYNAPALLCAGRVEAAVVYIANEPAQIARSCGAVNVIELPPEADLVGNGLITNEATIAGEPELVRGMVRALARGIADTLAGPDEAFEISRRYVETLPRGGGRIALAVAAAQTVDALRSAAAGDGLSAAEAAALADSLAAAYHPDEVTQMQVLLNSIRLWEGPDPGLSDPASWEATMNTLIAAGLLPGPLDFSRAYNHDFLP
ncbi:MAG: ABC transporter substrate-binding protein [Anaerolineae bacterium]|nr:ABC transporter substrate-binding protein [Anaerolineae bacterium]